MTDEQRLMEKLRNKMNDAVVISRMLINYETEADFMSIIGAVFDTWCDGHGVPTDERRGMLQRFIQVFDKNVERERAKKDGENEE